MRFVWTAMKFLGGIGYANRADRLHCTQLPQCAIVKTSAIANPIPGPVEGRPRHEHQVWRNLGACPSGTSIAIFPFTVGSPGRPSRNTSVVLRLPVTGSAVSIPAFARCSNRGRFEGSFGRGK
jgi:hypothetical protein